jgi:hypothetical protein
LPPSASSSTGGDSTMPTRASRSSICADMSSVPSR